MNIVISTSYHLLTGANRTTAPRFRFRHSEKNELKHFALNWAFLHLTDFKRGKYSFPSPIPSMQCCATVRATYRKQQISQLWMGGTGEGWGIFRSLKLPYVSTVSSPIVEIFETTYFFTWISFLSTQIQVNSLTETTLFWNGSPEWF